MTRFRNWWLGLPYPLWVLSACKPFAPWCLAEDLAPVLFPVSCGFRMGDTFHEPLAVSQTYAWICRKHDESVEKWYRKHHPEYFEED